MRLLRFDSLNFGGRKLCKRIIGGFQLSTANFKLCCVQWRSVKVRHFPQTSAAGTHFTRVLLPLTSEFVDLVGPAFLVNRTTSDMLGEHHGANTFVLLICGSYQAEPAIALSEPYYYSLVGFFNPLENKYSIDVSLPQTGLKINICSRSPS